MTPLNSKQAREYIIRKGIPMSDSKFYKLTSTCNIIFHRVGNRLLFYKEELEEWCKNEIITPNNLTESCFKNLIQSAQNKILI